MPGRRTWPQRLLITFNCLLVAGCVAAVGAFGWLWWRFDQIERIPLAAGVLDDEQDGPAGPPRNILLVGSDSRAFVTSEEDEASFGAEAEVGPARSDTVILLRVDPASERAAMVSFPRDLWVEIAGTGRENRINTAYDGSPARLIETIKLNFDVPVHHVIEVDFQSFQDVVEAVGGVDVFFPTPARDTVSGLDVPGGCVTLGGAQALAYVRSRQLSTLEDGEWVRDPSGDLGRIQRQQTFIRRAMREALSSDLLNPARVNRLVSAGVDNLRFSDGLDVEDLVDLGERFRSSSPEALDQRSLPVVADRIRATGASILRLDEGPEAEAVLDVFRGGPAPSPEAVAAPPPDLDPATVSVRVLNGSGRRGQAATVSAGLEEAGFEAAGTGDGEFGAERTVVRYAPGQEGAAALVVSYLEAGADLEEDAFLEGADVEVLTGLDHTGVRPPRPVGQPPPTPPTTTSTTAPADAAAGEGGEGGC